MICAVCNTSKYARNIPLEAYWRILKTIDICPKCRGKLKIKPLNKLGKFTGKRGKINL